MCYAYTHAPTATWYPEKLTTIVDTGLIGFSFCCRYAVYLYMFGVRSTHNC